MAGSSSGSGGGSGSGSHKKSSGGASGGGGGKHAAASGPTARKLSTKPLVATPLSAPLALDFSLADPALQTPQPLWPSWTAQRAVKQAAPAGGSGSGAAAAAAAAGAVYSDPEGLPLLPPSLARVCAGWRRLCDAAPYGAGVAEKGVLSVTPAEGFATQHRAVAPQHHREGGWATVVAAMLNLILAKRRVLIGNDAAAGGGGSGSGAAATGGNSAPPAAAAAAAAAAGPNFLWSHIQPCGKDGVVRWQPSGKYVLRVWHQCDWKLLVIDDQVPVDAQGRSLLPACSNPLELWPALLSKALLKLWPGVELGDASGSGGTEVLYSLCGWSTQSGVRSATVLDHPYPKANRPDGPVLPFNPLMEGAGGGAGAPAANNNTTAPASAPSASAAVPAPSSRARDSSSRGPTPSPSGSGSSSSAEKSASNKKKPSSARKDSIELDSSNSGAGGGEGSGALAASPTQPWSLEHTHAYASRRGELGWFNELVYAAPGSASVPPAPPGAVASAAADGNAPVVVPAQPPSGLLFAYAWAVVPDSAAADALLEGYPALGQLLNLDPERVPLLGAPAPAVEFDAAAAAALVAGSSAPSSSPSSSSAASASASSGATSSAPGSSHGRGRSGSASASNLAAPVASAAAGSKSAAGAAGKKGSAAAAASASNASAAALPSTPSGLRIDAHLDDAAAGTVEPAAAAGPRFLCVLVESFDESAARLAFEHQARLAQEAASQNGILATGPSTGKKGSSSGSGSGGKGGAKGAPGTPSSGSGGAGSGAGGSSSSKRASMGGPGAGAPPGTPGKGSSSSAAGAKDPQLASPQGSKPGTANAAGGGGGGSSKAGGSGASRSKLSKEEEAALRREEEQAALSLAAASRLAKQRADESARASRSQARMDAWLRGEEALLEEEERAKTTPQLLLTDLLSGSVRVARVDSFSARFERLQLVRDQARFDVVAPCVRDWWGGRELRRPFTSGAPAPLIFVPDLAPACAPLLPTLNGAAAGAAASAPANADGSEPAAASAALRAYAAHAAREHAANLAVIRAARSRRIYLQVEFQTNVASNGSATDAEPLPSIPSTASLLRGAGESLAGSVVSSPVVGKNKLASSGSGSKSRPISGGSAAKSKSAAAGGANGGASSPDTGPLQPPAPLSAAHALQWSLAIERFDWATNRREVVLERSSGPVAFSSSPSADPRRVECIELTLPELDASAEVAGATSTGAGSAALSRPASSGGRGKDKSGGSGKKGDKSSGSDGSASSGPNGFGVGPTGQPLSGALYRVVVTSNFGYALSAFSHAPFEMEEGKWGATGAALAAAAGEVVKEPSTSSGGSGAAGGKKGEVPSCHGSSAPTTAGGASNPLLERLLPSTHVRCLEGSYPAQPAGAHWVLFKYVLEVTTPPMPVQPPSATPATLAAAGSAAGAAQILSPNSSGEFVIAEEVALAVDTRAGPRSSRQGGGGGPSSVTTPKAGVSAADKKKAAAFLAAAQAAEAEAAAQAALAHAAAEAAAIAAANPGAPAIYHKSMLPATAAQANDSLSMSWLHPDKRAPGGTVCAPAAWKVKENGSGGAAVPSDMWSTPLVPANHPQSTLISATLSLQDQSLAPFVRLEWTNNDTLDSWVVPLGGLQAHQSPAMAFQPNTHGYTLVASAFLPSHAAFAGKFFVRVLTSRPLLSFGVENLVAQQLFVDEYRANTARNLCRLVVSGTTSAVVSTPTAGSGGAGGASERGGTAGGGHGRSESLSSSPACVSNLVPQSLLHFSTNLARSGLIARVYDLDTSLESAWNAPPPPLAVVMGVQSLMVPVLLASKDARKLLVEVSFAPLHPSAEELAAFTAAAHAHNPPPVEAAPTSKKESASAEKEKDKSVSLPPTGVHWSARFVSAQPLLVASDRAMEDELVALKSSWAAGDSQRAKKARAAREAFLELRQAQLARAAAPAQLQESGSGSGTLPPLSAAPSVSRGGDGGPTTPTSAAAGSKRAAQQAEPLVLPPIPPSPVVVYASDPSAPSVVVLTDSMREERAAALAAEVEAARLFRLSLERQKDCLSEYVGRAALARESALSSWRHGLEQRTHEAWANRAELRRGMITHEAELAELRAVVGQAPESLTANLNTVANYEECNASHTPFNQMAVATLAAANAPALSAKDAAKEAKAAAAAAAAAAAGGGSSVGAVGASPSSSASASRKKGGGAGAGGVPGWNEPSALESGRFGLASFLEAVETALSGPASLPAWKGGVAVAHAVQRVQSVLQEALQTPIQQAAIMHLQREQAPLLPAQTPGTPTAGGGGGGAAGGRKEKAALASVAKSAEGKAAAAAAEKTLADGSMLLAPLDRASMANALWHAVLNARNVLPKLSRPAALDAAAVQAELVLLALSVEQLERALEPLKFLSSGSGGGAGGSASNSSPSSPSGGGPRSLADKGADGEEKTNDDPLPSLRAPPPASPVSASHRAAGAGAAGGAAGAKGQTKSSRAAAAAALAAAAAAALPPQPDYAAIDAWSAQVRQYAHLIDLPVIAPHELHEYAPAAASIVAPHVAAVCATQPNSSRPASARVAPAPAPAPTSPGNATPTDAPSIADAQWFGAGSERARAQAAAAASWSATEDSETSPPALSAPSLSPAAPGGNGPLQLPAVVAPPSLSQASLSACGANAAAALGRDATVALLHSSLPASAGVAATAVAPRGGAGVPPGQSASAASAALSLSCCGLCFLTALQSRASALTAVADDALVERRAEQARVQAVADAAAAAQAAAAVAAAAASAHSDSGLPSKPSTAAPSHRKNASISTSNKKVKSASLKKSKN